MYDKNISKSIRNKENHVILTIHCDIYHKLRTVLKIIRKYFTLLKVIHKSEYYRAIGNAMRHGRCPLNIKIIKKKKKNGNKKCLLVVEDSGNGFDYLDIIHKYKNKLPYAHHHGLGTKILMSSKNVNVNWDNGGKTIIMEYKMRNNNGINSRRKINFHRKDGVVCCCKKCTSLQRRHK